MFPDVSRYLTWCIRLILNVLQSDNRTLSAKLAEKIAEERAKALLRSVDNKRRLPDDPPSAAGSADEQKGIKKSKHKHKGKGKGKK